MADFRWLQMHDHHVAEAEERLAGWLRWNLFRDNTPFMTMRCLPTEFGGRGMGVRW